MSALRSVKSFLTTPVSGYSLIGLQLFSSTADYGFFNVGLYRSSSGTVGVLFEKARTTDGTANTYTLASYISSQADLTDVTVTTATVPRPRPRPRPEPKPVGDRRCWPSFGGDPQRSLARPQATLGLPVRKHLWTRGLGSYIEYPPSYCDGTLYVNAFEGEVFAVDAQTGKIRWRRDFGGRPS